MTGIHELQNLVNAAQNRGLLLLAYKSYIFTKIVRFLLLQTVVSQDVTKKNFCFIPDLETYQGQYTDKMLCEMWGISEEEWSYIDSRIATIGGDDNGN